MKLSGWIIVDTTWVNLDNIVYIDISKGVKKVNMQMIGGSEEDYDIVFSGERADTCIRQLDLLFEEQN